MAVTEAATRSIGWGGRSLRAMLDESELLFQQTGRYFGLERLTLKAEDHFRYERSFAKLRGALVSARETALHISASPIVRNIGELCFALYTPEGDSVVLSTGIIVHVHTMSEAIKWMIRSGYEQKPGIREGDIFSNNDPALGNVHTTDVHTIIPIFWEGELIGWAGGVTHQVDIGGSTPGHDPIAPTSRFEDGLYLTCERIGQGDDIDRDHQIHCQRAVRAPLYWDLDEKCRTAGCYLIRDAVHRFIQEEGIDYYKQFVREVIAEGAEIFRARVRERLVPGRYRAVSFSDVPFQHLAWQPRARANALMHAPMEITVGPGGEFRLEMDGASAPGPFAFNCSIGPMQGALWVLLSQVLVYDGKVNDGSYLALRHHFPAGSWCNPGVAQLSYATPWYFLIPAFTGLFRSVSRGLFSRGYREEVVSGYGFTGDPIQGGGVMDFSGEYWPAANFEISCVGLGASAVRDGLDWAYAMWNPESDQGDAEVWELLEQGIPYLSRRVKPNTAGHGKRRGGSGWECLRLVFGSRDTELYLFREGMCFAAPGLFGGYPQATSYRLYVKNTNLAELLRQGKPYPLGDADPDEMELEKYVRGEFTRAREGVMFPTTFENHDLIHYNLSGGPGYGDPLEREPAAVEKDLQDGIFTDRVAADVFGVVAVREPSGAVRVDEAATRRRRAELRARRARRAVSYQAFWERERARLVEGRLSDPVRRMYRESLALSSQWGRDFREFWQLPETFQV